MVKRPVGRSPSSRRRPIRSGSASAPRTETKAATGRQRQVLRLVAEGLGNKEIAVRLKITPSGVKKHLEALTHRYGVRGRTSLVRAAIQAGDLRISRGRSV